MQTLGYAFAGNGRDCQNFFAAGAFQIFSFLPDFFFSKRIALIQSDNFRLMGQFGAIKIQFPANRGISFGNIFLRTVNQVQNNRTAFNMFQKPVAQSDSLMRPFNQAGNIGNDDFIIIRPGNAKFGCRVVKG